MRAFISLILCWISVVSAFAQHDSPRYYSNLSRNISVNIHERPLGEVLDKISRSGNFVFSYSGSVIRKDSVVSVFAQNKSLQSVLEGIFGNDVECRENGKYVILRSTVGRFEVRPENITVNKKVYEIDGVIFDSRTGLALKDVSVYEKNLLRSALTDEEGHFNLRFKGEHQGIMLTVSKENYRDTSIRFLSSITIRPEGYADNSGGTRSFADIADKIGLSRFFTSYKQRIQSLNIPGFLASSPFQASLLPGLGSQGIMSSNIVNKGSLNILGGYTAGVDGVEIAGIFNLNKEDVKKVQAAGCFNIVGGEVQAVQASGLFNLVGGTLTGAQFAGLANLVREGGKGVQAAGLFNVARRNYEGSQVSGLLNATGRDFSGMQASGLLNSNLESTKGVQIAGLGNITVKELKGVQVSGLFNFARRMNGTQVGLINLADTSSGYSIGLINLVRKGYHKLSLSSNEVSNTNLSFKTGNSKLYSIFLAGANVSKTKRLYSAGLGLGHDFLLNNNFSLSLEGGSQLVYLGNWDHINILHRLQSNIQWRVLDGVRIFAGPVASIFTTEEGSYSNKNFKTDIIPSRSYRFSATTKGWLGWNLGVMVM